MLYIDYQFDPDEGSAENTLCVNHFSTAVNILIDLRLKMYSHISLRSESETYVNIAYDVEATCNENLFGFGYDKFRVTRYKGGKCFNNTFSNFAHALEYILNCFNIYGTQEIDLHLTGKSCTGERELLSVVRSQNSNCTFISSDFEPPVNVEEEW